jgi:hypothetical protein
VNVIEQRIVNSWAAPPDNLAQHPGVVALGGYGIQVPACSSANCLAQSTPEELLLVVKVPKLTQGGGPGGRSAPVFRQQSTLDKSCLPAYGGTVSGVTTFGPYLTVTSNPGCLADLSGSGSGTGTGQTGDDCDCASCSRSPDKCSDACNDQCASTPEFGGSKPAGNR